MAPPRIGVVLNVGSAHVGEFGTREAIGRAKAELVQALPATGFAVLNADDPIVSAMAGQTRAHVIPVGESAEAAVRAVDISLDPQGRASFTLVTDQGSAPVSPSGCTESTTSATPSRSRPSPSPSACRCRTSPRRWGTRAR